VIGAPGAQSVTRLALSLRRAAAQLSAYARAVFDAIGDSVRYLAQSIDRACKAIIELTAKIVSAALRLVRRTLRFVVTSYLRIENGLVVGISEFALFWWAVRSAAALLGIQLGLIALAIWVWWAAWIPAVVLFAFMAYAAVVAFPQQTAPIQYPEGLRLTVAAWSRRALRVTVAVVATALMVAKYAPATRAAVLRAVVRHPGRSADPVSNRQSRVAPAASLFDSSSHVAAPTQAGAQMSGTVPAPNGVAQNVSSSPGGSIPSPTHSDHAADPAPVVAQPQPIKDSDSVAGRMALNLVAESARSRWRAASSVVDSGTADGYMRASQIEKGILASLDSFENLNGRSQTTQNLRNDTIRHLADLQVACVADRSGHLQMGRPAIPCP
jgi:hypothetical protein